MQELQKSDYKALAADYAAEWASSLRSADPIDPESLTTEVHRLYELHGISPPTIIVCQSPWQVVFSAIVVDLMGRSPLSDSEMSSRLSAFTYDKLWLACFRNLQSQLSEKFWHRFRDALNTSSAQELPPASVLLPPESPVLGRQLNSEFLSIVPKGVTGWRRSNIDMKTKQEIIAVLEQATAGPESTRLGDTIKRDVMQLQDEHFSPEVIKRLAEALRVPIPEELCTRLLQLYYQHNLMHSPQRHATMASFGARHPKLCKNAKELTDKLLCWEKIQRGIFAYAFYRHFCFISDRPHATTRDENGRFHNDRAPAILFGDYYSIYVHHGLVLPSALASAPESLTPAKIDAVDNITIHSALIAIYGLGRYLSDSGARLIQKDSYGELYQKNLERGEPITVVKVTNSTAEPDGSHTVYFLRVPPTVQTAKEAVAWTFGMSGEGYSPAEES